ncbi:cytochrome P450 716B1-like protein [Tanacetum coccineum]
MIEGLLSIPINFPFTKFSRGVLARKKMEQVLIDLIHEKREALENQKHLTNPHKDLITTFLSIRDDEDSSTVMSVEEIIDNIIVVMIGVYGTPSILITFLVKLMADNKLIYSNVIQEQEENAKSKATDEALTWEDLSKMKYTWRVASEMMRIHPLTSLVFRKAKKDIEYEGFIIPKGWQIYNDIFEDPNKFDLTRFEKHAPSPPPYTYVPFGVGPRMCPGIKLAKIKTLAMIHLLMTVEYNLSSNKRTKTKPSSKLLDGTTASK